MGKLIEYVKITSIMQCRNVIKAAMKTAGEGIGIKESNAKKKKESFWKRRISSNIGKL